MGCIEHGRLIEQVRLYRERETRGMGCIEHGRLIEQVRLYRAGETV